MGANQECSLGKKCTNVCTLALGQEVEIKKKKKKERQTCMYVCEREKETVLACP